MNRNGSGSIIRRIQGASILLISLYITIFNEIKVENVISFKRKSL